MSKKLVPPPTGAKRSPEAAKLQLTIQDLQVIDAAEIQRRLLDLFRSPTYKPPVLPSVALELSSLSRKKTVSYDEVARTVEKDPLIAASLLKLAQSPLYGRRMRVQSLREALNRLGISKLRDAVWQVVMDMRVFRTEHFEDALSSLQSHAAFTAHAARLVAQTAGIADEQAFLSGLLHDIGWSGMLVVISESSKTADASGPLLAALDGVHAEVGATMAKLWGLSDELIEVLAHHHASPAGARVSPLVHVLRIAEGLAEEFGFAAQRMLPPDDVTATLIGAEISLDASAPGTFEAAVQALNLQTRLDALRAQAEQTALALDGGDFSD